MNAKVRGEVDLKGIYIRGEARSEKIPAQYQMKTSAVGFASHRRTWGTRGRKNLMRARLECRSAKNVPWAIKNASSLVEVGRRKHRVTTVASKSSFLPEEPERRISRGYCRGIGPGSSLSISMLGLWPKLRTWVCPRRRNLCQKRLVFGYNGSIKWSDDKCLLG